MFECGVRMLGILRFALLRASRRIHCAAHPAVVLALPGPPVQQRPLVSAAVPADDDDDFGDWDRVEDEPAGMQCCVARLFVCRAFVCPCDY